MLWIKVTQETMRASMMVHRSARTPLLTEKLRADKLRPKRAEA
jgi:hypothetical protein